MTIINTCDLTGAALDWAVECALTGRTIDADEFVMRTADESYCEQWAQGGPIIEREHIAIDYSDEGNEWCAAPYYSPTTRPHSAPTPLIAAMRCYVASKLGGKVAVPDELL